MTSFKKKIRVLIVDDSEIVRRALSEILSSDSRIEILGTASDPYIAVRKIQQEVPDVITLDMNNLLMMFGTILWFISAPFWMNKKV